MWFSACPFAFPVLCAIKHCVICYIEGLMCYVEGLMCYVEGLMCYVEGLMCYVEGLMCNIIEAELEAENSLAVLVKDTSLMSIGPEP